MAPSKSVARKTRQISECDNKLDPKLLVKKCLIEKSKVEIEDIDYLLKGQDRVILSALPDWFHFDKKRHCEWNSISDSPPDVPTVSRDFYDLKIVDTFSLAAGKTKGQYSFIKKENEDTQDVFQQNEVYCRQHDNNEILFTCSRVETPEDNGDDVKPAWNLPSQADSSSDVTSIFSSSLLDDLLDAETKALEERPLAILKQHPEDSIKYRTPSSQASYVKTLQTALKERQHVVEKPVDANKVNCPLVDDLVQIRPSKKKSSFISGKSEVKKSTKQTLVLKPTFNLARVRSSLQKTHNSKIRRNLDMKVVKSTESNVLQTKKQFKVGCRAPMLQTITLRMADSALTALHVAYPRNRLMKYEEFLASPASHNRTGPVEKTANKLDTYLLPHRNIRKRINSSLLVSSEPSYKKAKLHTKKLFKHVTLHKTKRSFLVTISSKIADFALNALDLTLNNVEVSHQVDPPLLPPVTFPGDDFNELVSCDKSPVIVYHGSREPSSQLHKSPSYDSSPSRDRLPSLSSVSSPVQPPQDVSMAHTYTYYSYKPMDGSILRKIRRRMKSLHPPSLVVIISRYLVYQAKVHSAKSKCLRYRQKHFFHLPVILSRGKTRRDSWKLKLVKYKLRWIESEGGGGITLLPKAYHIPDDVILVKCQPVNKSLSSLTCARVREYESRGNQSKKSKNVPAPEHRQSNNMAMSMFQGEVSGEIINCKPRSSLGEVHKGILIVRVTKRGDKKGKDCILAKILSLCKWGDRADDVIATIVKSHSELQTMQRGKYIRTNVDNYLVEVLRVPLNRIIMSLSREARMKLTFNTWQSVPLVKVSERMKSNSGISFDRHINFAKVIKNLLDLDKVMTSGSTEYWSRNDCRFEMKFLEVDDLDPAASAAKSGKAPKYKMPNFVKINNGNDSADKGNLRGVDSSVGEGALLGGANGDEGVQIGNVIEPVKKFEVGRIGCLNPATFSLFHEKQSPLQLSLNKMAAEKPRSIVAKSKPILLTEKQKLTKEAIMSTLVPPAAAFGRSHSPGVTIFPSDKSTKVDPNDTFMAVPIKLVSSSSMTSPCLVMCTTLNDTPASNSATVQSQAKSASTTAVSSSGKFLNAGRPPVVNVPLPSMTSVLPVTSLKLVTTGNGSLYLANGNVKVGAVISNPAPSVKPEPGLLNYNTATGGRQGFITKTTHTRPTQGSLEVIFPPVAKQLLPSTTDMIVMSQPNENISSAAKPITSVVSQSSIAKYSLPLRSKRSAPIATKVVLVKPIVKKLSTGFPYSNTSQLQTNTALSKNQMVTLQPHEKSTLVTSQGISLLPTVTPSMNRAPAGSTMFVKFCTPTLGGKQTRLIAPRVSKTPIRVVISSPLGKMPAPSQMFAATSSGVMSSSEMTSSSKLLQSPIALPQDGVKDAEIDNGHDESDNRSTMTTTSALHSSYTTVMSRFDNDDHPVTSVDQSGESPTSKDYSTVIDIKTNKNVGDRSSSSEQQTTSDLTVDLGNSPFIRTTEQPPPGGVQAANSAPCDRACAEMSRRDLEMTPSSRPGDSRDAEDLEDELIDVVEEDDSHLVTSRDILSHDQLSQAESLTSQDEESIDLSEVTPGLTDSDDEVDICGEIMDRRLSEDITLTRKQSSTKPSESNFRPVMNECERDHHDFKKIVSRTKERIRRDNLKKSLMSLNNSLLAPLPKISVQGVLDRAIKDCNELKKKEMLLMPALQALRLQRTCLTRYLKLIRPGSRKVSSDKIREESQLLVKCREDVDEKLTAMSEFEQETRIISNPNKLVVNDVFNAVPVENTSEGDPQHSDEIINFSDVVS